MRLLTVALLCTTAFGQADEAWPITRPQPDNTTGLTAPRLLRLEKGAGQTKKLQLSWTDRILKPGATTRIVTNIKIDAAIRIKTATEFFRNIEIPIEIKAATIDGKNAMPTLKEPRFTAKMLASAELVDGLVTHGMGTLTTDLRHKCSLLIPTVPLRQYLVGDVLNIPVDRFIKQLGVPVEGNTVAGKVYHHMPEKLFHPGESATIITTFTFIIKGNKIVLPSGAEIRGKLRIRGRRTAKYADIGRDGYLKSCTLEMESEYVVYKQLDHAVISISTLASVNGGRWSPPPALPENADNLENGARVRWTFRPAHEYAVQFLEHSIK